MNGNLPNPGRHDISLLHIGTAMAQSWGRMIYWPIIFIVAFIIIVSSGTLFSGIGFPRETKIYLSLFIVTTVFCSMLSIINFRRFHGRIKHLQVLFQEPHYVYYIGSRDSFLVTTSSGSEGLWLPHSAFRQLQMGLPSGIPHYNAQTIDELTTPCSLNDLTD